MMPVVEQISAHSIIRKRKLNERASVPFLNTIKFQIDHLSKISDSHYTVFDCKFCRTSKATTGLYYSQQFFCFATIYSRNERTQFCMWVILKIGADTAAPSITSS